MVGRTESDFEPHRLHHAHAVCLLPEELTDLGDIE